MNWFDKIKSLTTKNDYSPELKKGEIREILLANANKTFPDFQFLTYRNSCYTFQRIRKFGSYNVYETLHIIFTLKDQNFACSIASRLNPNYININSYNTGLINPHTDLIGLKKGTGVIPVEEAYYFHNGQVATTTKVVQQIFEDYKQFGIPFLEKQLDDLQNSETIKAGLNFIELLTVNKAKLQDEITNSINQTKFGAIHNDIYDDLKQKMYSTLKGRMKDIRDKIPKTAFELLELFWAK